MGGLSRRQFLKAAGATGAISAAQTGLIGATVFDAARADPAGVGTTLAQTIRKVSNTGYSKLGYEPGEPYLVREDLGARASSTRTATRRGLLYFAHHTDTHIVDAQSPARLEPGDVLYRLGAGGAFRPQETLTVQVLDQMIRATNGVVHSTLTGAPMAFTMITGDLTDSNVTAEHRWLRNTYDGKVVTPNTGGPDYEGVQVWPEARYAFHPDGPPGSDVYLASGFPNMPGLLEAAISPVETGGMSVPWYCVFGNHDLTWVGALPKAMIIDVLASSNRKATELGPLIMLLFFQQARESVVRRLWEDNGRYRAGTRIVTPDPENRKLLSPTEWMASLLDTEASPGPVGHGFSPENVSSGRSWYGRDDGPLRIIGMDSCNHFNGSEGSITQPQYDWIEAELIANSTRYYDPAGNPVHNPSGTDKLIAVFSHHNSWSMTNTFFDPNNPYARRFGPDMVALFNRFPNMVAWVNGHSHENKLLAHRNPWEDGAGFWEINSASCIDFGQHQRTVEIVDNRDGTVSLFTVVVDHLGPADSGSGSYTGKRLASLSREMSANDPFGDAGLNGRGTPYDKLGHVEDRNCELLVKAPFDLGAAYPDTRAQLDQIAWESRILSR